MEPPTIAPPAPEHPEFGRLVTARRPSAVIWLGVIIFLVLGGFLLLGGVTLLSGHPADRAAGVFLAVLGAAVGGLGVWIAPRLRDLTEFFEFGVQIRRGGRVLRSMSYADCDRFWYTITRHYSHGFYAGTAVALTLKAQGRPTVAWSGRYKEKPKGLSFTILGKGEFKGEDELDLVRTIIADAMADRWIDHLAAGGRIGWLRRLELGPASALILNGRRKGQDVPYADLDRVSAKDGLFHLFHRADERSCVTFEMKGENFWPGMRVLERMWRVAAEDAARDG